MLDASHGGVKLSTHFCTHSHGSYIIGRDTVIQNIYFPIKFMRIIRLQTPFLNLLHKSLLRLGTTAHVLGTAHVLTPPPYATYVPLYSNTRKSSKFSFVTVSCTTQRPKASTNRAIFLIVAAVFALLHPPPHAAHCALAGGRRGPFYL